LLDEAALLTCMVYVDLNPVRAGMAKSVGESDFTSIQQRLFDHEKDKTVKSKSENVVIKRVEKQHEIKQAINLDTLPEASLMHFDGSSHTDIHHALPFTFEDYIALVDSTGRVFRQDKRSHIKENIPILVSEMGINPDSWLEHIQNFGRRYAGCVGNEQQLVKFAESKGMRWCKGVGVARQVYAAAI